MRSTSPQPKKIIIIIIIIIIIKQSSRKKNQNQVPRLKECASLTSGTHEMSSGGWKRGLRCLPHADKDQDRQSVDRYRAVEDVRLGGRGSEEVGGRDGGPPR